MAMQTDVLSTNVTASGAIFGARTRLRQVVFFPSGTAGSVIIYDNATTNSGNILWQATTTTNTNPVVVTLPGEGTLAYNGIYAALSNVGSLTATFG